MILIGIMGKAQSGKDSTADIIDQEFGFITISFAEALKDACRMIYGFTDEQMNDGKLKVKKDPFWNMSPREALQALGVKVREIDKDIWVKTALRRGRLRFDKTNIEAARSRMPEMMVRGLVIPDVRFKNEAQAIKDLGGYLIRVVRTDLPDPDAEWRKHISETDLDDWKHDFYVESASFVGHELATQAFLEQVRNIMFLIIKEKA